MDDQSISLQPIGIIHTPFKDGNNIPRQPYQGKGIKGKIEIFPEFASGLEGLEQFKHIVLIFNFHLSKSYNMKVIPYNEDHSRGVFATRAPHRPNQVGMSIVTLDKIDKNILEISNVDIINGTPLLDIKPFVIEMDCFDIEKLQNSEWLAKKFKKERV